MEVIASFVPSNASRAAAELAHPPAGATTVELRADLLDPEADLAPLIAACPRPVLLTLRSSAEGGRGPVDLAARRRFFERAVGWPAALWDVEAARDGDLIGSVVPRERAVVSAHWQTTPADLEERVRGLLAHRTVLAKAVPTAHSLADALAVLSLNAGLDHGDRRTRRAVVFSSGEAGRATRLLAPLLGAPVAYAAWAVERAAAPGQYTPEELLALIGHLSGRPRRLFAVLGRPVGGSLSPRMHNAAYRALGLPNLMVPFEIENEEELDELLTPGGETALDDLGLPAGGYAVTMPCKEAALARCTLAAPRARRARAVNTVLPRAGKVLGDCTDIDGITVALREAGVDAGSRSAVVLGAGATARAAVVALELAGAQVRVWARREEAARALAAELGVEVANGSDRHRAELVVNATPAGRDGTPDEALAGLAMPPGATVLDLPYGARPTFLELLARERGWRYISGREVLLYQGIAQFAAHNGVAPPVAAMAQALGLEEVQG